MQYVGLQTTAVLYICIVHVCVQTWGGKQRQFGEIGFLFPACGCKVIRLGDRHLYQPNHLATPDWGILKQCLNLSYMPYLVFTSPVVALWSLILVPLWLSLQLMWPGEEFGSWSNLVGISPCSLIGQELK